MITLTFRCGDGNSRHHVLLEQLLADVSFRDSLILCETICFVPEHLSPQPSLNDSAAEWPDRDDLGEVLQPARELLQKYWGYREFRPLQGQAIQSVLEQRDSLLVLPTGGGKSLCYQVPALLRDGVTIVVSPLIALMKDQVDGLRELGIAAAAVNSSQTAAEQRQIALEIEAGRIKLLYVAPERLCTERMIDFLSRQQLACIAVD